MLTALVRALADGLALRGRRIGLLLGPLLHCLDRGILRRSGRLDTDNPERLGVKYNKDQWIFSFEDAMVKLRPHMGLRVLTTIGLMAWNQKGTKGVDPAIAALEWSKSMEKAK